MAARPGQAIASPAPGWEQPADAGVARPPALAGLLGSLDVFRGAWPAARIPGLLQRIAVVYLVAALAWLHLGAARGPSSRSACSPATGWR